MRIGRQLIGGVLALALAGSSGCGVLQRQKPEDLANSFVQTKPFVSTIDADHSKMSSLERAIRDNGYIRFGANVSSIDNAQVIMLGDIHTTMGDEQTEIFKIAKQEGYLKKGTKVFVESSSLRLDFSTIFAPSPRRLLGIGSNNFDDAGNPLENITGKERFTQLREGEENSLLNVLAAHELGEVKGTDAPRDIKVPHLYNVVQREVLGQISKKLISHVPLHDFEHWMLYQDLHLCNPNDLEINQYSRVMNYLRAMPSEESIRRERDLEIAKNTINEIKSATQLPSWFRFGTLHITSSPIIEELEKARIRYIAFIPDSKRNFVRNSSGNKKADDHKRSTEYFEKELLPWYVEERAADGSIAYEGSVKGVLLRKN